MRTNVLGHINWLHLGEEKFVLEVAMSHLELM